MTWYNHCHPIITNPSKSAKDEDIDLKLSWYDHMDHLRSNSWPILTRFNLTSFVLTFHDHGDTIKSNLFNYIHYYIKTENVTNNYAI